MDFALQAFYSGTLKAIGGRGKVHAGTAQVAGCKSLRKEFMEERAIARMVAKVTAGHAGSCGNNLTHCSHVSKRRQQ